MGLRSRSLREQRLAAESLSEAASSDAVASGLSGSGIARTILERVRERSRGGLRVGVAERIRLGGCRFRCRIRGKGAVAVEDLFAGDGGDAVAGDDDAGEVDGVGGGYGDDGGAVAVTGGAEGVDGFGEGVLFAAEAGDEAAAADLAAGFEAAEDVEEIAPLGGVGLAGEEIAEEDAVAGEEKAGEGFEGGVGAAGLSDGRR